MWLSARYLVPLSVAIGIICCSQASYGARSESAPSVLEEILIIGSKSAAREVSGSASFLDEADLDRFDQVDLRKVLNQVAGVYIREEDGFGLRPNIGIRGAAAERSQKVTLMRDGVLITPAPYSAPAAYYVPNVSRIGSVEVLKGPSATAYGPHTVGGAINFGSLAVPASGAEGFADPMVSISSRALMVGIQVILGSWLMFSVMEQMGLKTLTRLTKKPVSNVTTLV